MARPSKSAAKSPARKLSIKKDAVRDLAPAGREKGVKGGKALTLSCVCHK